MGFFSELSNPYTAKSSSIYTHPTQQEQQQQRELEIEKWKKSRILQERVAKFKIGYIYFVLDVKSNLVKIGFTQDIWRRFSEINLHNKNVVLLGYTTGTFKTEKRIHRMFNSARVYSEWFNFSSTIKSYIELFSYKIIVRDEEKSLYR
jgi:hypothetical protein